MSANGVILSYGLIGLTRYKHGSCLGLTVFFLSTLLIYNSAKLWPLTPVAIFSIPFLPIFNSLDDLVNLLFINIRSQNLLIYGGVFALVSLTNTVMNWLGFQNKSHTTRGVSWLYLLFDKLLSRYIPVSEFFICCFVEPVLAIGAGIYLWRSGIDATFGSFLILMGTNEIVFQLIEHSHRVRVQTFLKG